MNDLTTPAVLAPRNISRAFLVCWIALFAAGFAMMLKLSFSGTLKAVFFDTTSPLTSAALVGGILGVTYLGFTICNTVLPPFIDALKIKRVLIAGLVIFNAGFIVMIMAEPGSASAYDTLWLGALLHGIGWGCIESVVNPVVPSLYPNDKAAMLNRLHTSWPLGWMLAGLLAVTLESSSFDWRYMFSLSLLPASVALVMLFFVDFPPTERVANGVSFKGMCKEIFVKPGILVLVGVMFFALACETVPQNWLDIVVGQISGIKGTWLLIYVAIAYLLARGFAEIALKRVHAVSILIFACLAIFVSVLGLAYAKNPYITMGATALLGIGAALLWPNMLAIASERYPNTGSLGIGLMCAAGMASGYVVVPWMGGLYDGFKVAAAGGSQAFEALAAESPAWIEANAYAAMRSFELFSVLPLALAGYFLIDYLLKVRRKKHSRVNSTVSYAK
ncbi:MULTISPECIES: MFS transporter [Pseudomonas]|uniref:MFS transporter n=1 Tax=Pseudomonas TaxID=286 RepID=UPI000C9B774F|nr:MULTISPECIES: MFS transporter [Pseudomonas]MDH0131674.1 MFS transporter [Pseudomonas asiatica]PNG87625.1 Major Facilitator Superfamily protein [Pseudomonas putida]QNV67883.1 MFS transporter [Pseudomonas sp. CFA]